MPPSMFADLCDIADALDRHVRDLPPGPERDRLQALVERLDGVIDRTVGIPDLHLTTTPAD